MNLLALSVGGWIGIAVAAVVVLLAIIFICWAIAVRNRFVTMRNQYEEAFATIDIYLKKRYDLIPNLVETVKGYAAHEKALLEDVTRLRTAAMQAGGKREAIDANARLDSAVRNLVVSVERYPELKSNASFLDLQARLADLEKKIAISRQFYNDTVMKYNEAIERMPSKIIAGMFRFEPKEYFQAYDNERSAPEVKF